jgi:hypothetical protein
VRSAGDSVPRWNTNATASPARGSPPRRPPKLRGWPGTARSPSGRPRSRRRPACSRCRSRSLPAAGRAGWPATPRIRLDRRGGLLLGAAVGLTSSSARGAPTVSVPPLASWVGALDGSGQPAARRVGGS